MFGRLEQRKPEVALGPEVVEEASLAGQGLRDHGVDARGGEPALEHESLGGVEDPPPLAPSANRFSPTPVHAFLADVEADA